MSKITLERTSIHKNPPQYLLLRQAYRQLQAQNEIVWRGQTEQTWSPISVRPTPPRFVDVEAPDDTDALLEEYHFLVNLDRRDGLTAEQRNRLRGVEEELDDLDEMTPGAHWMKSRMAETTDKLDALLQAVRDLAARRSPA